MKIEYIDDEIKKERICSDILNALPDWFGLPDATQKYIEESKTMPFWAAFEVGEHVGFICLKETSTATIEIYVMGILTAFQHQQIGSKLFDECERYAKQHEYEYMQVKTVKEGIYKEYDQSNAFYKKMGFKNFECFPTLWDEWNPCQILIKHLG